MARKVQKRGKCIFCLGYGLSREHIFPDWMRDYLEDRSGAQHQNRRVVFQGKGNFQTTVHPGKFARPGETRGRKARVVCKTCNNTWMSGLQNAAKTLLIPLITGKWLALDHSQQKTIAAWATMFSMVLDAVHPENSGVSQQERTSFMQTLTPPDRWLVWMGVYGRPRSVGFWHDGYFASTSEEIEKLPLGSSLETKMQTNVFVCGHALFHTFSAQVNSPGLMLKLLSNTRPFRIRRLWPISPVWRTQPPEAIPHLQAVVLLERVNRIIASMTGRR